MKRLLFLGLVSLGLLPGAGFAAALGFTNNGILTTPIQIDAINVVNRGTMSFATIRPFETFDTLNFINQAGTLPGSGVMIASPGFWFNNFSTTTGLRLPASSFFVDNGAVVASQDPLSLQINAPCSISLLDPSYLLVWATNITVRGGVPLTGGGTPSSLIVGANGWMELRGTNVNVQRSGLEVLPVWDEPFGSTGTRSNFTPDIAFYDLVWAQTNFTVPNPLRTQPLWDGLFAQAPPVNMPPAAPGAFGGFLILPGFPDGADSYMANEVGVQTLTNFVESITNFVDITNGCSVTVTNQNPVFFTVNYSSNVVKGATFVGVPPDFSVNIAFTPSLQPTNRFQTANVLLSVLITNAVTGQAEPAYIRVQDTLASDANARGLAGNLVGCPPQTTARPANFLVDRTPTLPGAPGNTGFPPGDFLLSSGSIDFYDPINIILDVVTNPVATAGDYAAYGSFSDNIVSRPPAVFGATVTNLPGRVRIIANSLNLDRTRIRGEGEIMIETLHLISSTNAVIDCEALSFDLASTNGILKVKSMVPPGPIARFRGNLSLWSGMWGGTVQIVFTNNYAFTNIPIISPCDPSGTLVIGTQIVAMPLSVTNFVNVGFHAFMVDASLMVTAVPVSVYNLTTRSPNVVIDDTMTLVESMFINGRSFTLNGGITFAGLIPANPITGFVPPVAPLLNWVGTNAPDVLFFTNNGVLNVTNEAHFGDDRPGKPYSTFVNTGALAAASVEFNSTYYANPGTISVLGPLTMRGVNGKLENGTSTSGGDTAFYGSDVKFNAYTANVGGAIKFGVTNNLSDAGPGSGNILQAQNGFSLLVKPKTGDLLGTLLQSAAPALFSPEVDHFWAGQDFGPTPAGFSNNAAIGVLELSSQSSDPLFVFFGTGPHNGLYADLLDLNAFTSESDLLNQIVIDPSLTIYFAAASLGFTPPPDTNGTPQQPEEYLNGLFGGHLLWVPSFGAGPNSSSIVLVDGVSTGVNTALLNSMIIDSDQDGLPNGADAPDVFVSSPITVNQTSGGTVIPNINGQPLLVGSTYSLTAVPADGFAFSGWSGSSNSGSPTMTFLMSTGLTFNASFTFVLSPGTYNGLFFEDPPEGVEIQRSGFITFTTSKTGKCTGSVAVAGKKYSFTGQLTSGALSMAIPNSTLTLNLQVGNEHATGTITGAGFTANIQADRAVFNSKTNKAPFAGRYTAAIPGTGSLSNTNVPQGFGYATITVDASGKFTFGGTLADGSKISGSSTVSEDGSVPLFVSLYKGNGQLLGWLAFVVSGAEDLGGGLSWIKQPGLGGNFYPNGFDIDTLATGSAYVSTNKPVTGFSNAAVELRGGNPIVNVTNLVFISPDNNKVTNLGTNKFSLKVTLTSGLFQGSAVNPATGKSIKFNGVILQKQGVGSGFFLGTDQSGEAVIEE